MQPLPPSATDADPAPHLGGAPLTGAPLQRHVPECFACGTAHTGGLGMRAWAGRDSSAAAEYVVTPAHQGPPGFAHGGVLACALDETMAAVVQVLGVRAVTRSLTTEFLAPVPVGARLRLTATATAVEGRRISITAVGRLADSAEAAPVVRGQAVFVTVEEDYVRRPPSPSAAGPTVQVSRLDAEVPLPAYARPGDAGADLVTTVDVTVAPGERAVLPTGLAVAVPEGYAAFVHPRSGLAARCGIGIVNAPGTIDAGYRGEVQVIVINLDPREPVVLRRGDRIAQLVIQRVEQAVFAPVEELPASSRGTGGLGSTGR